MIKIKKDSSGRVFLEHDGKELPGLVSLFKVRDQRAGAMYSLQMIMQDETEEGNAGGQGIGSEDSAQDDNQDQAEREDLQKKVETQKIEVMKGVWVETRTGGY